jgi:iron complex outermembrane receptor protein
MLIDGKQRRLAVTLLTALLLWSFAAWPDAPLNSPMEELVVWSQLRDGGDQDLPVSMTVIDRGEIESVSVQHFEELIPFVPNLNWSGEGSRARYFQIRGTGELEGYQGAPNPSVGFIVDDIDFSSIGGIATTFDMQQVEVLRGPQGTRYGANALAGLIYARTADPTDHPEAYLEATAGNDETWSLGGAAGGPVPGLEDQLSYRVAVQAYQNNGFRHNEYLDRDDTYNHDEFTGRAKLRWRPAETWQIDLTGFYVNLDNGYDAWAIDNGFSTYSDKPGDDRQKTLAGSVRAVGEVHDAFDFVSITGIAHSDINFSFDADWGNDDFWAPYIYDYFQAQDRERDTLNQEFRLVSTPRGRLFGDSTDWVTGVYWHRLDETLDQNDLARDGFPGSCPTTCSADFSSDYDAHNLAFFGELDSALSARTSLVFGLRWEHWNSDYTDTGADFSAPGDNLSFDPDDNMMGGDLSLVHAVTEHTQIYGRIARGYKAGGFNLDPFVDPENIQYDKEHMWNYEVGAKARGQQGRWAADLSIFYQDRNDMQVKIPVQDELGNPSAFSFFTDNAEDGTNVGLEVSGRWLVVEQLQLHASLGLLHTEIDSFSYDPGLEGRDQAHAPNYNFAVGATWFGPKDWFGRVDIVGSDAFYFDYGHDAKSESYEVVNLRAGKAWRHWSVDLWARNIFDENYAVRGFFFGNEPPDFPEKLYTRLGDPRHYGVTLKYRY